MRYMQVVSGICRGVISPLKERGPLVISSGTLGSVQYHFVAIIPRSTLTQRKSICYGLIYSCLFGSFNAELNLKQFTLLLV